MTQELYKIVNDLDNKRKKVNLNIQVQLNAQIFKQNFELITSNLLKVIFNEIYPETVGSQRPEKEPAETGLSQSRKMSDNNMLQNMSVSKSQIIHDQTYSKFQSSNNDQFNFSSTANKPKKKKIALKSTSKQKNNEHKAKYNKQLSMFNNQLKNMSSISYINPIEPKKDDFSIDNQYSGHS